MADNGGGKLSSLPLDLHTRGGRDDEPVIVTNCNNTRLPARNSARPALQGQSHPLMTSVSSLTPLHHALSPKTWDGGLEVGGEESK